MDKSAPAKRKPRLPEERGISFHLNRFGCAHRLSPQQLACLRLSLSGLARKESAGVVGCSIKTVEEHWRRIYVKTGCRSELGVLAKFVRASLSAGKGDSQSSQ